MEEKKFEFDERAPYAYFQNTACPYFPCHKGEQGVFQLPFLLLPAVCAGR